MKKMIARIHIPEVLLYGKLADLMGAADQVEVVLPQEVRDDVRAEGETHAAVVLAPALDVGVRVRPSR